MPDHRYLPAGRHGLPEHALPQQQPDLCINPLSGRTSLPLPESELLRVGAVNVIGTMSGLEQLMAWRGSWVYDVSPLVSLGMLSS